MKEFRQKTNKTLTDKLEYAEPNELVEKKRTTGSIRNKKGFKTDK